MRAPVVNIIARAFFDLSSEVLGCCCRFDNIKEIKTAVRGCDTILRAGIYWQNIEGSGYSIDISFGVVPVSGHGLGSQR